MLKGWRNFTAIGAARNSNRTVSVEIKTNVNCAYYIQMLDLAYTTQEIFHE